MDCLLEPGSGAGHQFDAADLDEKRELPKTGDAQKWPLRHLIQNRNDFRRKSRQPGEPPNPHVRVNQRRHANSVLRA